MKSFTSHVLPQSLTDRVEEKIQRDRDNKREWVLGVLLCAIAATIVMIINIILTITAVAVAYSRTKDQGFVSATLYEGKCSTPKNWARGLHLLINILSTIMLAASNYCMQCLSSPSRQNIDDLHPKQEWLDIGIPSLKNLFFIGWRRRVLWMLLLVSSLPIHLMFVSESIFLFCGSNKKIRYNSAVFYALGTNEYHVMVASSDFDFDHQPSNDTDFANCFEDNIAMSMSDFYSGEFQRLEKEQCIDAYAVDFLGGRGNLVIITNNSTVDNKSLLWAGSHNGPRDSNTFKSSNFKSDPFGWMCEYLGRVDIPNKDPGWYRNYCQKRYLIGDWSVVAQPWTAPLINATIFSDDIYTINTGNISGDISDHEFDSERDDLITLEDLMDQYPQAEEMRQYLDDASRWNNSTWASNITVQPAGSICTENKSGYYQRYDTEPYTVDYCLSQKIEEKCQLVVNLPICLAVIFCNAVKVICMFLTAHDERREILLTVGDAVSSFMDKPDMMTEGNCLLSKFDIIKFPQSPTTLQPDKKRWMKSVSISYWVGTISLYVHLVHLTSLVAPLTFTDALLFLEFRVSFLALQSLN